MGQSEDTGLVYPLSGVRRAERSKFTMKDYFSFEEQGRILIDQESLKKEKGRVKGVVISG